MVEIVTFPAPMVVESVVSTTESTEAAIAAELHKSLRSKEIPAFGGAGRIAMRDTRPVCNPMPLARISFLKVF